MKWILEYFRTHHFTIFIFIKGGIDCGYTIKIGKKKKIIIDGWMRREEETRFLFIKF